MESQTFYRDKDGNEITKEEYEFLQFGKVTAEKREEPQKKPTKKEGGK